MRATLLACLLSASVASTAAAQLSLPTPLVNFSEEPCGVGLAAKASSVASIGDVDGDGLPDIVVGSAGTATAAGASAGRVLVLSAADRSVLFSIDGDAAGDWLGLSVDGAGDVDLDGTPDFVYGVPRGYGLDVLGSVRVHSGADGALLLDMQQHPYDAVFGYAVFGGADINGDGRPDVVALSDNKDTYGDSYVSALSGANGALLHQIDTWSPFTPALAGTFGDVDDDGCDEILVGSSNPENGLFAMSIRSGATGKTLKGFLNEWGNDAGDYNGDGWEDLLFHSGRLVSGRDWETLVEFDGGGKSALLGDVDGDGGPDYALGNAVHTGTGGPAFTASQTLRLAPGGDIDGDGALDLLGVSSDSSPDPGDSPFKLLLNRPALLLETLAAPTVPANFERVLASPGDLDGDGHPDLLVGLRPAGLVTVSNPVLVLSGEGGATLMELPSPAGANDFGTSVAGAGDVDADGVPDIVIGGPGQGFFPGQVARIWVHSGADGTLIFEHAEPPLGNMFGQVVAGAGDLDGDGFADIFVGAPLAAGKAWAFAGPAGAQVFKTAGTSNKMRLGASVAPAGDVDQDGHGDLFVGAPGTGVGVNGIGAVLVLSGDDGAILQTINGQADARSFGITIAALGDVDSDGRDDFLAGWADKPYPNYFRTRIAKISGATGEPLAAWEHGLFYDGEIAEALPSVAAGDVDGDGLPDVLAGVPTDGHEGHLVIRSGANGTAILQADGKIDEQLGSALFALDVDGDGRADALADVPGAIGTTSGELRAFTVAHLAAPWTYAGHGLAGTRGLPQLLGFGEWRPGEPISLQLDSAIAQAPTFLVVGLSAGLAAFKGGTLVPAPDLLLVAPPTDAAGSWLIEAHAPAIAVSLLLLQAWVPDAAAPHHFAASNGLLIELP